MDSRNLKFFHKNMVPKVLCEYSVSDPNDPTWIFTNISWSTDPEIWEGVRAELADIISSLVSVNDSNKPIPGEFILYQNYPNPFNLITAITFTLPKDGFVSLKVCNLLGEEVATLIDKQIQAGQYPTKWDTNGFANNMYYYQLFI